MSDRKLPEIEGDGLSNKESGDDKLNGSSGTWGSGESWNGRPEESHNEGVEKAVGLDERVRSAVVPANDVPVVERPDHHAGDAHQNAEREEKAIRIRGGAVVHGSFR